MQLSARHQEYWSKNLRITALLLGIWFFVTFVLVYLCTFTHIQFFWLAIFVLGRGSRRIGGVLPDHLVLRPLHEQA